MLAVSSPSQPPAFPFSCVFIPKSMLLRFHSQHHSLAFQQRFELVWNYFPHRVICTTKFQHMVVCTIVFRNLPTLPPPPPPIKKLLETFFVLYLVRLIVKSWTLYDYFSISQTPPLLPLLYPQTLYLRFDHMLAK